MSTLYINHIAPLENKFLFAPGSNEIIAFDSDRNELVLLEKKVCTLWNRFLGYFGVGELTHKNIKLEAVAKFLSDKWESVQKKLKNDPQNETLHKNLLEIAGQAYKNNSSLFKNLQLADTELLKSDFDDSKFLALSNNQTITEIDRKTYTLFNRLLSYFGVGPLKGLEFKLSKLNDFYINLLKDKTEIDSKVKHVALKALQKGNLELFWKINDKFCSKEPQKDEQIDLFKELKSKRKDLSDLQVREILAMLANESSDFRKNIISDISEELMSDEIPLFILTRRLQNQFPENLTQNVRCFSSFISQALFNKDYYQDQPIELAKKLVKTYINLDEKKQEDLLNRFRIDHCLNYKCIQSELQITEDFDRLVACLTTFSGFRPGNEQSISDI